MLPTLTEHGYITNKHLIVRKLWEYFLAADYSQSNIFRDYVYSLRYIVAKEHPDDIGAVLESTLSRYYGEYFDNVEVETEVTNNADSGILDIGIYMVCYDDDDSTKYNLHKKIKSTNGQIDNFDKLVEERYDLYYRG